MRLDNWHPFDLAAEAEWLASGVSYLACEIHGVRHIAPMGTPAPDGLEAEVVYAAGADPNAR
jgi:hypothetical protein